MLFDLKEYGDTKTATNVFKIFSELDNHFYFLEPEFLGSHPESLKRYEELSDSRKSEERVVYKR